LGLYRTGRQNPRLVGSARTALLCAALTLSVAGAAMPTATQSVQLVWKLEAGTELRYHWRIHSATELPQGMGSVTMRMESTQRWSVSEVDGDGNATVQVTTEWVIMSVDGPMGMISADSADETDSGSPLDAVRAMAGTSYTIILDPRGALVGVSGVEEMRETLRTRIANPSAQAAIDRMLGEEALRSQWAQGVSALPTDAVGVGSTWETRFSRPFSPLGSITVATVHEVEYIGEDLVVIGGSGAVSVADDAMASSPIPVKLGDASVIATTRFDAGRGLLLSGAVSLALQMTMAMDDQEGIIDTFSSVAVELIRE